MGAIDADYLPARGRIERFEDLIAWQKARQLTRAIYQRTRQRPFAQDFGLATQAQRAAVSIMANIAEGFERGGRGEFHQFLSTAKASCAEVRSAPLRREGCGLSRSACLRSSSGIGDRSC